MIGAERRKAIFTLHQEGMGVREIARRLHVSRNRVRAIIEQEGVMPSSERSDKKWIDPELLRRLYADCQGRIQRVYEKLTEEEGITVAYSTLTGMLRELEISKGAKARCHHVPDEPGAEMQHDTSVYHLKLAGKPVKVIASLLYLRYSKRRYLKFYRSFNRFKMKCFLHEGLTFWGYSAGQCIIDNTNLARLRGTGANAVMIPEMEAFAKQYGFVFRCHEKGHSDRKAGEERSFWTVETNFFPGRTFEDMGDLNEQALAWSTQRMDNRPQGRAGLIPAQAFEHERLYLTSLPPHLPAPYEVHERTTDPYGYAAFDGNYYWVPGTKRYEVKLLQYSDRLKIYRQRECLVEYLLPAEDIKNAAFPPLGSSGPAHPPKNRRAPAIEEERQLRAIAPAVSAYLDFALGTKGLRRHQFLRKLLALSRKVSPETFIKGLERATKYRITALGTLERIFFLELTHHQGQELPSVELDEDFQQREAYQEGSLTEQPDLSIYENLFEDEHE